MSASLSPFTRRVERRFEVKKSNSGVEEEEAGRKNIKDKIRVVTGQGRSGEGGQEEQIFRLELKSLKV